MHSAPSVTYPVGRSRFAGLLLAGIWLLGAAAVALWAWQSDGPGWRHVLAVAVAAAAGFCAAWGWWRSPAGELAWEANAWTWSGQAGQVVPGVDLQRVLLLRWRGIPGTGESARWLWLERARCPQRWDALRRAVYSRAVDDALQAADAAAKP